MRRIIMIASVCGLVLVVSAQEIFKTKWQGIGIQTFTSTSSINQFSVYSDGSGYVYLKAHSSTGSEDIVRTQWKGSAVQDFSPGSPIVGFQTFGPDFEGYVYLRAVAQNGLTGEILKTRWQGTKVQEFTAPSGHAISGFTVSGPDAEGYVTLTAVTAPIGIGEKFDKGREMPLIFALNPITPNPGFGPTHISYSIPKPCQVNLKIYDCSGQLVKRLVDGTQNPGIYNLAWQGTDAQGRIAGPGIYFVKMEAGNFKAVKKVVKW